MSNSVKPIPEGYHAVTPYLIVQGAAKAIDFYKRAFLAKELFRMEAGEGKIAHAELQIGSSRIMLADEHPEMNARGPESFGGSPVSFCLYVENVDEMFPRSITLGAVELRPLKNQFYGDRSGTIKDPFGHTWTISTHVEDVSPEEMEKRASQAHA